nr:MAG TPA: hypothetical protein [Caudoviricetes sp.]
MSLNLIYDRTQTDVNAAGSIRAKYQALRDWSGLTEAEITQLERGTLTNVTLNRVANAVSMLAPALNAAGYTVEATSQSFSETDRLKRSKYSVYLANVQTLRDAYYTLAETRELPAPEDKLKYTGANTIEKVLADIDLLLDGMKSIYRRAGTFTAGGNYVRQMIRSI